MTNELIHQLDMEIKAREDRLDMLRTEMADIKDQLINLKGTREIFTNSKTEETSPVNPEPVSVGEFKPTDCQTKIKELEMARPCPYKDFADLLSTWMEDSGLTNIETAELLQVRAECISRWKHGQSVPQERFRQQIAETIEGLSGNSIKQCDVKKALELSDTNARR